MDRIEQISSIVQSVKKYVEDTKEINTDENTYLISGRLSINTYINKKVKGLNNAMSIELYSGDIWLLYPNGQRRKLLKRVGYHYKNDYTYETRKFKSIRSKKAE